MENLDKIFVLEEKALKKEREDFVYGTYDYTKDNIYKKVDNFLIDHSKISLKEKSYFFSLLAVMIDSGVGMMKSLKILAKRAKSERFYRIINTLAYDVERGKKLSDAMSRFPDIFTDAERGVISSGEAVGNLDQMLERLAKQVERTSELVSKVKSALIYPITVLVALVVAGVIMMVMVVPTLIRLFAESNIELPLSTRTLIGVSFFVSDYWWVIAVLIVFAVLLLRVYVSSPAGRFKWDLFKLKIPIYGNLLKKVIVFRFVSLLGVLLESGFPIADSLDIVAKALGNELYRVSLMDVKKKVVAGETISENLKKMTFLFPNTLSSMISIGEKSAAIGLVSRKISNQYDREIDTSLKGLTSVLEPVVIVIVGLTVGLLALSILGPIFSLSEQL